MSVRDRKLGMYPFGPEKHTAHMPLRFQDGEVCCNDWSVSHQQNAPMASSHSKKVAKLRMCPVESHQLLPCKHLKMLTNVCWPHHDS
jgi:hypothetical protein